MGAADEMRAIQTAALVEKLRCASKELDKDSPDPPCESCPYAYPDAMFPGEYICDGDTIMICAADLLENKQREIALLRAALARKNGRKE